MSNPLTHSVECLIKFVIQSLFVITMDRCKRVIEQFVKCEWLFIMTDNTDKVRSTELWENFKRGVGVVRD